MISLSILNGDGDEVGTMEVDEARLGGTVHRQVLREAVLMHQARSRVGSASTKTRSEVNGSTKKLWRQKGTGRARPGDRKSPLRNGGGAAFGPKPRDYSYAIPRKVRRRATQSALLAKLQDGEVTVVESVAVPEPKTRHVAGLLKALGIADTCLIVTAELDRDVYLASRNVPGVAVLPVSDLNAYDLVAKSRVLIARHALNRVLGD